MSELAKLRDDHAVLAKLFRQLGEVIQRPKAASQLELFELRRELTSTLIAHLKLEDWALYPRLIGSDDGAISATGQHFQEEMGGLAPAFVAYCDKWSANAIEADWGLLRRNAADPRRARKPPAAREPRAASAARTPRPRRLGDQMRIYAFVTSGGGSA